MKLNFTSLINSRFFSATLWVFLVCVNNAETQSNCWRSNRLNAVVKYQAVADSVENSGFRSQPEPRLGQLNRIPSSVAGMPRVHEHNFAAVAAANLPSPDSVGR